MRKQDEVGRASNVAGRAALGAVLLLLVFACLNPRPEELPSGVDQTQPVIPGLEAPDSELADPVGVDESSGDDGARTEEAPAANPASAPPPAPDNAGAPAPDAGADTAPDAGSGESDAG